MEQSVAPFNATEKLNTGLVTFLANESVNLVDFQVATNGFPRWRAFDIDSNGKAVFPSGNGGRICGVSLQSTIDGEAMPVILLHQGIAMVEAGEALATVGVSLGANSSGQAVAGSGLGVLLMAAAGSGSIVAVLLTGSTDVVS